MTRRATYRLQLRPEFGFAAATAQVSYLRQLGVSHVYCSPYLQATSGSSHGYDVVDHGKVNGELGGEEGRDAFCEALGAHGLQQLLDIVPNHMAIRGGANAWWWDVLQNGPSSRFSQHFDVEWRSSEFERVLLPILGDQYGVELEAGRIVLHRREGAFFVRYFEHENPVAPRSLGHFLRPVAETLKHSKLGFVADALVELPSPNATDGPSRRRRHRDIQVLVTLLEELCREEDVAQIIDLHIARTNSSPDALHELLEGQNYRLAFWRIGNHELDYRRFFDIDSLVGLRVEDEEVFEATHLLVCKWLSDKTVDGLRIDHIDGLYDPLGYLERLRQVAPSAWLLVEKILEDTEELPPWPVSGTTGYEFLNLAQRLFTHPNGEVPLDSLAVELMGAAQDYPSMVEAAKRLVLREALGSDLHRLVNRLVDIVYHHRRARDYSRQELEELLVETCVEFSVYRTYAHPTRPSSNQDVQVIRQVCDRVRSRNARLDPRLVDFMEQLLLLQFRGDDEVEFVLRFQQLTGPVMAKGVEDTTFYRFVRLLALNEVGGDPSVFHVSPSEFHESMARRQVLYPDALNATSTHDTKRSEDVRARLLALSEVPERWAQALSEWRSLVSTNRDGTQLLDPATEYLLWQCLVGAWPIEQERLQAFAQKAVREAKVHTSWHSPQDEYESAVRLFIERLYESAEVLEKVASFVESLSPGFFANALGQTLLKMTCPGVPDIYQGTELWDFSLVDPDNRRPVDYELRRRLLDELGTLQPDAIWQSRESGIVKLHFVVQALRLRTEFSECFGAQGSYRPLVAEGKHAQRVVAFGRGSDILCVVTLWWLLFDHQFEETALTLPEGRWNNSLTGVEHSGKVPLSELLGPFPCALLSRLQSEESP